MDKFGTYLFQGSYSDFELANYNVTIQHIIHYDTGNRIIREMQNKKRNARQEET